MSKSRSKSKAQPTSSQEDEPLSLDDSSDGSTQPVGADQSASSDSAQSGADDAISGSGTSTGGFDTMLGKLVVRSGLATSEEIELCDAMLRESAEVDEPRTLADLMVDNGFITNRQLDRLRTEFEDNKTTEQIPGYTIKKKLGSGAMATVYLARQLSLDRLVAIKILPKKFTGNAKFVERFYKEGRAAARLNHPNIVGAVDVGKAGDHHYFVMEYVDGPTIYDRIKKGKRVKVSEAIQVTTQVAYALHHAHERGFIHRDIKPKNIMVTKQGVVKLADLGLARAMSDKEAAEAEAGRAYGTPYYISPEQIRGEIEIGPPADIYGLGATFYHMVTGKVPFSGKNPSAVMHKHLKAELIPPDHIAPKVTAGCAQVIEMMMAKIPAERYQNAVDLLTDLRLIAKGQPPHFAHKSFDLSAIGPALKASEKTGPVKVAKPRQQAAAQDGSKFIILMVILIMSLLANFLTIWMYINK